MSHNLRGRVHVDEGPLLARAEADREPERSSYADTILTNATVYTEDAAQPRASGVAIQGKAIIDVIRDETAAWRRLVGPETKVFDLGGRAVIPGLIDSHTHPGRVAVTKWRLVLPWTRDLETLLAFIKQYAGSHPPSEVPFIHGEYYSADLDWGPNGPTAAAIDACVSDRPVLLEDILGHASVVNSRALELMGVDADTPVQIDPDDPAPRFVRGSDGRTPTGWILEYAWKYFANTMYDALGWRPPSDVTPRVALRLHELSYVERGHRGLRRRLRRAELGSCCGAR